MRAESSSWYAVKSGDTALLFEKHSRSVERPTSVAAVLSLRQFLGNKSFAPIDRNGLAAADLDPKPSERPTQQETPAPTINAFRIVLTEGCDYGCTYCFEAELHRKPKTMTEATLERLLDKLLEISSQYPITVHWFGGEPLLFFGRIRNAVDRLQQRSSGRFPMKHVITTHGGLVNKEIAEFFRQFSFSVWVSMDGPQSLHDEARRTKAGAGTHAAASSAIKLLVREGVDVGALVTVGPHNLLNLHRLPQYFKTTFGIRAVSVNSPQPVGDRWTVDGGMFARELYRMAIAACLHDMKLSSKFGKVQQLLSTNAVFVSDCAAADGSMGVAVGPDGSISPCIVEWREIVMGVHEIDDESLLDWKLQSSKHEECRVCIAEQVCGGPCPLEAAYSEKLNADRCRFYQTMVVESVRRARS